MLFRRFALGAALLAPLVWVACSTYRSDDLIPLDAATEAGDPIEGGAADSTTAEANVTLFEDGENWSSFNLGTLAATGWTGAALAGHYIYLSPADSTVARYDIDAPFTLGTSWSTFDVSTLAKSAGPACPPVFDGKWMYFAPFFNTSGRPAASVAYRVDTTAPFTSSSSWQAFSESTLRDGGVAPSSATVFDGTRISTLGYPKAEDAGTKPVFHLSFPVSGEFGQAASWTMTASSTLDAGTDDFVGGAIVGSYLYSAGVVTSRLIRMTTSFTDPVVADLNPIIGAMYDGFYGVVAGGQYVYLVPLIHDFSPFNGHGKIVRYDTTLPMTEKTSFAVYDLTSIQASLTGFAGGIFDGRYLYLTPYVSGLVVRYDTMQPFGNASSYSVFDISRLTAGAAFRNGGVFDGQYVYFAPSSGGIVVRFKARTERIPVMPRASNF